MYDITCLRAAPTPSAPPHVTQQPSEVSACVSGVRHAGRAAGPRWSLAHQGHTEGLGAGECPSTAPSNPSVSGRGRLQWPSYSLWSCIFLCVQYISFSLSISFILRNSAGVSCIQTPTGHLHRHLNMCLHPHISHTHAVEERQCNFTNKNENPKKVHDQHVSFSIHSNKLSSRDGF